MAKHEKIQKDPRIMNPLAELFQKIQEILGPSQENPPSSPQDPGSSEPSNPPKFLP